MDTPNWLEFFEHTADIGMQIRAPSLEKLFERAAHGMFTLITEIEDVDPQEEREVRIEGTDLEHLVQRWLSELNYLHVTQELVFRRFHVSEITDNKITAEVEGEQITPGKHAILTEIKAVTYHGLKIENLQGEWILRVLFDL
ncbi:MAG: archease [Verrucomicrobia bacterium]|nr:archease [Verrucomicrobiota bacterium]